MIEIKSIIFDLGGVVYDIRYENIAEAFARHGVKGAEQFYGRTFQTREMDLFEIGLLSPKEFRDYIRQMTHTALSDNDIDDILNAILIDIPQSRIDLLLALKAKYRLFLFSNTNQINYDCYTQAMRKKYGFDVFAKCFDACYFSHIIHMRKPGLQGFREILSGQQLNASETLFIDDNKANIEAARLAGLYAYLIRDRDISDLFGDDLDIRAGIVR